MSREHSSEYKPSVSTMHITCISLRYIPSTLFKSLCYEYPKTFFEKLSESEENLTPYSKKLLKLDRKPFFEEENSFRSRLLLKKISIFDNHSSSPSFEKVLDLKILIKTPADSFPSKLTLIFVTPSSPSKDKTSSLKLLSFKKIIFLLQPLR